MYKLGNIFKNEIKREKKNNPEKFIETQKALELKNQDQQLFSLGLLSKNLEDIGIETAIEKDDDIDEDDEHDSATTILEYIMNGYIKKKKYDLHFDFGKQRNEELLKNKKEYEKLKGKLKQKLSKDYSIPEEKIIIFEPKRGSLTVPIMFQDDNCNNIDLNDMQMKLRNDYDYPEFQCIKGINKGAIMSGCKLTKKMLDPRGDRSEGWGIGELRGQKPYYPPLGWIGIGLNVLDKYDNGNNEWIGMINSPGEWCVAYHGVGGGRESDEVKSITGKIINSQFKSGSGQVHEKHENINKPGTKVGIGVYCTPKIDIACSYSGESTINGKKYNILFIFIKL
jgi:hypothetical protein